MIFAHVSGHNYMIHACELVLTHLASSWFYRFVIFVVLLGQDLVHDGTLYTWSCVLAYVSLSFRHTACCAMGLPSCSPTQMQWGLGLRIKVTHHVILRQAFTSYPALIRLLVCTHTSSRYTWFTELTHNLFLFASTSSLSVSVNLLAQSQ